MPTLRHNYFSETDAGFPLTTYLGREIGLWEDSIKKHKEICQITESNLPDLCKLLENESDPDTYLTSPAYYAFTGRNGLWIYQERDSFIPFCWHPNVAGQLLVFPERGKKHAGALLSLLGKIKEPPLGIRLARVKQKLAQHRFNLPLGTAILAPVTEQILDWKYPVRVLSTDKVAQMSGSDFRYIRNHVRRMDGKNIQVDLISDKNLHLLEDFIYRWAKNHAKNSHDLLNVLGPYQKMIKMLKDDRFGLKGFVFSIDGKIQAFTSWDISNGKKPTANRFANLCNLSYRGLAEFVTKYASESLAAEDIQYMNIGGSETTGLDQFKSKFMPAYSLPLYSVEVVYENFEIQSLVRNLSMEISAACLT